MAKAKEIIELDCPFHGITCEDICYITERTTCDRQPCKLTITRGAR